MKDHWPECLGMRKQSYGGHACFPAFGLCLRSLDYALGEFLLVWKQDRDPVVPIFGSP